MAIASAYLRVNTWGHWCDTSITSTASITTGDVWKIWTTSTSTTTSQDIWRLWSGTLEYENSAAFYNQKLAARDRVFQEWSNHRRINRTVGQYVDRDERATIGSNRTPAVFTPPRHTEEQRARIAAEEQERADFYRRQYEEMRRAEKVAVERAEALLIGCLTVEQREQYRKDRAFIVRGRSGRRYRIRYGTHGNVDVIDRSGRGLHRLCVQPSGVPVPDSMLTQKLWFENDEEGILRAANMQGWPGNEPLERRPQILAALN
jgi:hypothetical protein